MITYLNTKAKPFTVYLLSLCGMGLFLLSTAVATTFIKNCGFIIGIPLMFAAIPFHIAGKKHPLEYIVSIALNAIGSGFIVSEYYATREFTPSISDMLLALILPIGIITFTYLMLQIWQKTKGVTITIAVVLNLLLLVAALIGWIREGGALYSFAFFSSLVSLCDLCVFGVTVGHDERAVLRDVSFGGFGVLIAIAIVVIVVLSEGDILDGFIPDIDIGGGKKKSK